MSSSSSSSNSNNNNNNIPSAKGLGWVPDIPDFRDQYYQVSPNLIETGVPPVVDLRQTPELQQSPILDQGQLGSCTANAIAGALTYTMLKQKQPLFQPSRLFIYYNERAMEGSIQSDAGAMLRDGIKSVNRQGACKEQPTWPYDIYKFTTKPPGKAYNEAGLHQALQYRRLNNADINQLKACLASGFPFVFGFTVYQSFMTAQVGRTGMMPMPQPHEAVMGGHAVLAVGYDDTHQVFIVRNSWGDHWGDKGYFYMPYSYITNQDLAVDFWTITMVEQ